MEQQDIPTGRTKRTSQETSRFKKLDKHIQGNQKMEKTRHGKGTRNKDNSRKLATWNIRGLSGKVNELIEECQKIKVDILGITETKKKGQGSIEVGNGYYLIYSGVPPNERPKAGVGCLINEKWRKKILGWTYISERIIKVEAKNGGNPITITITYGPNEDEKTEEKNKFWEEMNLAVMEQYSS
jgi:exonuclease III